jgi:hypothetical protein
MFLFKTVTKTRWSTILLEKNGAQPTVALRILEACPGNDAIERYLNEEKLPNSCLYTSCEPVTKGPHS